MKGCIFTGAAMACGLLLSGCGGGGSDGVASTPPPTYTKLADLTGNQTFQSAGVHFLFGASGFTNETSQTFGSGVVIEYNEANDSYTLTAPDSTTETFSTATSTPPPGFTPDPDILVLFNSAGIFSIGTPAVNGVALSYTAIGSWNRFETGAQSVYLAVSGVPTIVTDMPKNGTATYQTDIIGSAFQPLSPIPYILESDSSATFSADFGAGTVTTSLNLAGSSLVDQTDVDFGSYTGTGSITSGGPGFSGTLTSAAGSSISATGEFSGAFFGPQAKEMGYAWFLTSGPNGFNAQGAVVGTK